MSRIHSTLIALLIGAAATAGLYAAVHTAQLGQKAPASSVSAHVLASRQAKLAAWRHSLDATRAKRPPALPKLPHFAPVRAQPAPAPAAVTAPPPVTYVQAPTVVKYEHSPAPTTTTSTTSWTEDESGDDDSGDDSSGDDGGDDGDSGGGD
jgi:hypothetical protein